MFLVPVLFLKKLWLKRSKTAAGHITCEIYLEGSWAYFDPRCSLFYLWEDGRFMSVDDVIHHRERIYQQEDWVKSYHNPLLSNGCRQVSF